MKFSDVVGSLLSPSLPDSRDLKDKLHAAVDSTVDETSKTQKACAQPRSNCAIATRRVSKHTEDKSCPHSDDNSLGSNAMPYVANMNDYVKKDSIPCYGCNLK